MSNAGWWMAADGQWYPAALPPGATPVPPAAHDPLGPTPSSSGQRGRLLIGLYIALGVAVVAAVVIPLAASSSGQRVSNAVAAHLLADSLQSTEAQKTAHIQLSMSFSAQASSSSAASGLALSGSGEVDFVNHAASLTLHGTGSALGQETNIEEVVTGGNVYVSIPDISNLSPGKSWLEEPVPTTGASTSGVTDPSSLLAMLSQEGNTVSDTGPATVDGQAVEGYHVDLNIQALLNQAQTQSGTATTPGLQQLGSAMISGATMDVYINPSLDQLVQTKLHMALLNNSVTMDFQMDLSDYGAPVTITPPPPSEVATQQQLGSGSGNPTL